MTTYRVQFVLHTADSNPENYITNTWCCVGVDDADALLFVAALKTFYTSIKALFSNLVAQNGHEIKVYNMDDPKPRAPINEDVFNFATSMALAPLPPEVALCISFQGPKISGVPQSRRRGRIYIGPLASSVLASDGRPATASITTLVNAGSVLKLASAPTGTWDWHVLSAVSATSTEISNGWVDNEFDTQRRRGRKPTTRATF